MLAKDLDQIGVGKVRPKVANEQESIDAREVDTDRLSAQLLAAELLGNVVERHARRHLDVDKVCATLARSDTRANANAGARYETRIPLRSSGKTTLIPAVSTGTFNAGATNSSTSCEHTRVRNAPSRHRAIAHGDGERAYLLGRTIGGSDAVQPNAPTTSAGKLFHVLDQGREVVGHGRYRRRTGSSRARGRGGRSRRRSSVIIGGGGGSKRRLVGLAVRLEVFEERVHLAHLGVIDDLVASVAVAVAVLVRRRLGGGSGSTRVRRGCTHARRAIARVMLLCLRCGGSIGAGGRGG